MAYKAKFLTPAEGGLGAATVATSGKILVGNGTTWIASTPTFPNASATTGKFIISDGTNWIASTPTIPNTSGTSGKILVSNGTNFISSTPTFPNASATTGKFIISDGTNWIASTPTIPSTAGTAGKILVSDGTNFVSSTPTFPNASASAGKFIRSDGTNWIASTPTLPTTGGTTDTLLRSDGTNWVNTSAFKVSSTDIMTNTAQPGGLFSVHTAATNATGNGTSYQVVFDQIIWQQGSNFNTTTGTYTVPVAGIYQITGIITFNTLLVAHTDGEINILSGAGTFSKQYFNPGVGKTSAAVCSVVFSGLNSYSAGQTIYINVNIAGSTKTVGISADSFGLYSYLNILKVA